MDLKLMSTIRWLDGSQQRDLPVEKMDFLSHSKRREIFIRAPRASEGETKEKRRRRGRRRRVEGEGKRRVRRRA